MFLSSELLHERRENRTPAWRWGPCRRPREPSLTPFLRTQAWLRGFQPVAGHGPGLHSWAPRPEPRGSSSVSPQEPQGPWLLLAPPLPDTAPLLPLGPHFPRGAEQPEHGPSSGGGVPVRAESEPGRSCWLAEKRRIVTLFVTGPSCGSDVSRRLSHRLTRTSLRAETAFAPSLFPARSLTLCRCSKTP